jgi:hypothetical protein
MMRRALVLCASSLALPLCLGSPARGQDAATSSYHRVEVKPPPAVADPSFQPFYDHLKALVRERRKKDIEALVGPGFFWERDLGEDFDRRKGAVANFRSAVLTIWGDFWKGLDDVTRAPTASQHPERAGVVCSPGELAAPEIDKVNEALPALGADTALDVLYAAQAKVPVLTGPNENAAILLTLQNEVVPMDHAATGRLFKQGYWAIRLPDGRRGYVRTENMYSLVNACLCFAKTAAGWRIVGFIGGGD